MRSADHKNVGVEESPRGCDSTQEVVGNTHGTALDDGKRTGLNGGSHFQLVVSPDDGLNQLLPVTTATEQEHEAEGKDEMSSQEHDSVGSGIGAVAVDHLHGLSPEEITKSAIDGDGTVGKIAVGDVSNGTVGIHRSPDIALHLP